MKKDKKIYFIQINNEVQKNNKGVEPSYLRTGLVGITNYLAEAGLFDSDEVEHAKALRKDITALEVIPTAEKRLYHLANHIDGMKFERDSLLSLINNIENGTIGSYVH